MRIWLNSNCNFINVDEEKIENKYNFPLCFGRDILIDNSKIKNQGIKFTPFEDTISSIIDIYERESWHDCQIGISNKEESKLINNLC